jgi:hypothetical protein
MSTMSAITRRIWINLPPILNPNPRSQSASNIMMIVQSMGILFGENGNDAVKNMPRELHECDFEREYHDGT